MPSREPKTRHLRAAELRAQLDQLFDQAVTRAYDRASLHHLEPADRPKSDRTATHADLAAVGPRALPKLGAGKEEPPARGQPLAAKEERGRAKPSSKPHTRARANPVRLVALSGAATCAVLLAIFVPGEATLSSSPAQAAAASPSGVTSARELHLGAARIPALVDLHDGDWETAPSMPSAVQPATAASSVAVAEAAALPPDKPVGQKLRHAVDHLLSGRTRDALEQYRALSREPGASAELAIVASLLELELRRCSRDVDGEAPCGR